MPSKSTNLVGAILGVDTVVHLFVFTLKCIAARHIADKRVSRTIW